MNGSLSLIAQRNSGEVQQSNRNVALLPIEQKAQERYPHWGNVSLLAFLVNNSQSVEDLMETLEIALNDCGVETRFFFHSNGSFTTDDDYEYLVFVQSMNLQPKYQRLGEQLDIERYSGTTKGSLNEMVQANGRVLLARYATLLLRAMLKRKAKEEHQSNGIKPIKGISKSLRFAVLARDGFRCRYCGRPSAEVPLHIDHINPKSKGGADKLENYITACQDCNLGKHAKVLTTKTKQIPFIHLVLER